MDALKMLLYATPLAVSLAVLAVRRWRKIPPGFTDTVFSLVCISTSCMFVERLSDVPWLYTMLAIFSLMAIIVRQYRRKEWGLPDTVCGVVYIAAATRVLMGLFSLSWLPAVGVAAGAMIIVFLAYCLYLVWFVK